MMFGKPTTRTTDQTSSSPVRESFSLKCDDIPGAKAKAVVVSKNTAHYGNKLTSDISRYEENLQKHQLFNSHEYIYGGELKVGLQKEAKHGKRHYGDHYRTEIGATDSLKRGEQQDSRMQAFDYPRNLNVADIPGTIVGSSKPRTVINHDLAQKIRRDESAQKERPEPVDMSRRKVEDSLDRFQQERTENVDRSRRTSQTEKFEPRAASLRKESSGSEVGKSEQSRDLGSESRIREVFDSSVLYRNAAGAPTKIVRTDMSFDGGRKKSSQDYSFSLEKERMGIVTDRRDETNKLGESQTGLRNLPMINQRVESGGRVRLRNEAQRLAMGDSKGWKESVLEQAYGKMLNKRDDLKKVYTFNIISNQPNPKMLPSNARLPYRYAIPFDVSQLDAKNYEQQKQAETQKVHNLLLQHNNLGREYNQSVPVGRESYQGAKHILTDNDYNNSPIAYGKVMM